MTEINRLVAEAQAKRKESKLAADELPPLPARAALPSIYWNDDPHDPQEERKDQMTDNPRHWTDAEVVGNMQLPTRLNKARQEFSNWSGKIDQAGRQRQPLSPIELRRMEFEVVLDIIVAYTIGDST